MSAEDQEMLAKISQLAGQINRHKNQQAGLIPPTHHHQQYPGDYRAFRRPRQSSAARTNMPKDASHGKSAQRGTGYYQPRGFRVGKPAPHRHRSLILNASAQPNKCDADSGTASDASTSSWVTKNDRHLQLINSSVYEKETQARTKAMEQTRLQKQQRLNERERAKLINHFGRVANSGGQNPANNAAARYEVVVQGIRFYVTRNGSKLVKVPGVFAQQSLPTLRQTHECEGDPNPPGATPKTAVVGGVKFYRSKNGNLYRHAIVRAQRYVVRSDRGPPLTPAFDRHAGAVKKVNQPCSAFSTTGISLLQPRIPAFRPKGLGRGKDPSDEADARIGSCPKGPRCRYVHDASKVAACRDFLQKGGCAEGDSCDLSHDLGPERTPYCLHFAKGNCTNPNCRYAHVTASAGAPVCRPFGTYGYCEKGAHCSDRHVFECPDFSNDGVCKRRGCKLLHRERASVLRKANTRDPEEEEDEDMADVSSEDDGESADSDDIDSDEVDEFFGADDVPDVDFATQKDFIEF